MSYSPTLEILCGSSCFQRFIIKALGNIYCKGRLIISRNSRASRREANRRCVFATCTGVDEEDEVVLLKEFKEKLQSIEAKKDENSELIERNIKVLESTFTAAKKHIEETAFQRKELRAWLDKEYPNLIKIESSENDSDLYITRTTT